MRPMLTHLIPHRFGWHEERTSETVRCFLAVDRSFNFQDEMTQLMREVEPLALRPISLINYDDRQRSPCLSPHPCREAIHLFRVNRQYLDAPPLEQLDKVRNRVQAEPPMLSQHEG